MAIDKVGYSPVSFKGFYTDPKGSFELACELVGKANLEKKFIQNIVEPLTHTHLYDVFVSGSTAGIVTKDGKGVMSIVYPGSFATDRSLGVVYDIEASSRRGIRRTSEVIPTENFKNDGYLLHVIETAKNIVFDLEAAASKITSEPSAKIATETIEEKTSKFAQMFSREI
jgi:hypothetical protein